MGKGLIMNLSAGFWVSSALLLILSYQNCDGGFRYDPNTVSLASLDLSQGGVGDSKLRLVTISPTGQVFPEGASFESGPEYQVRAVGEDLSGTVLQFSLSQNEPEGNCLIKPSSTPEARFVQCSRSGRVAVRLSAVWPDGSISALTSERTTSVPYVDPCGGTIDTRPVFRIPQATGSGAWNNMGQPVRVFVGQTLRICNDDSTPKRLQTPGNPCSAQAQSMLTGEYYDCPISSLAGADAQGNFPNLFNGEVGPAAPFYVRAFDGAAVYRDTAKTTNGQSCASCHGASAATSAKRNRSATQIRNAIIGNAGGMGVYRNASGTFLISDDELEALAYSLAN